MQLPDLCQFKDKGFLLCWELGFMMYLAFKPRQHIQRNNSKENNSQLFLLNT